MPVRPTEEPQNASEAEVKLPESEGGGLKEIPNAASDSKKKKKKKKKGKASASGPGNAEEAQAMRGVLGAILTLAFDSYRNVQPLYVHNSPHTVQHLRPLNLLIVSLQTYKAVT